ncbi:unnamed protein product [Calicophoron daubneyi]|uniref:Disks large 1 tumor suppressor protein n=1 Tax=Calicophoron daubneyi TaxID=300641 RepID=A0AAV2TWA8_CALDB
MNTKAAFDYQNVSSKFGLPRTQQTDLKRNGTQQQEETLASTLGSPVSQQMASSTCLRHTEIPPKIGDRMGSLDVLPFVPRLTTTLKKTMTVRALFEYDPSEDTGLPSRGLAFQHGDILHVVNANDSEWWQARRYMLVSELEAGSSSSRLTTTANSSNGSLATYGPLGIIPSWSRIERRQRMRLKRVNFFTKITVIGSNSQFTNPSILPSRTVPPQFANNGEDQLLSAAARKDEQNGSSSSMFHSTLERNADRLDGEHKKNRSNSLTRSLFRRFSSRNKPKRNNLLSGARTNSLDAVCETDVMPIRSYEIVVPVTISLARPLLLFGPLKERIIDTLLQDPKFATCVPHTSRPPRPDERDGIDYHFAASNAAMEADIKADKFIEVGQFQDHYYATSIDSVRQTLLSGRICVLDVGLPAIRRLENAGLHPISVLLKPISVLHLRTIQRRLTEDQAKRSIELASRLEADNWHLFSVIVPFDTIESAVKSVQRYVLLQGGPVIWVPSLSSADHSRPNFGSIGSQSSTLPRAPH